MRRLLALLAFLVAVGAAALATPLSASAGDLAESRILVDTPVSGSEVARGAKVPVKGRLEWRRPDGGWAPADGAEVEVQSSVTDHSHHPGRLVPVTGGRFASEVTPRTGRVETFRAVFKGDTLHAATSREFQLTLSAKTFLSFDAFMIFGKYNDLSEVSVSGGASWSPDLTWPERYYLKERPIRVEFKAAGTKSWKLHRRVTSDNTGAFSYLARVRTPGQWRARYEGEEGYLPATSAAYFSDTGYDTKIVKFDAGPEPVSRTGTLTLRGRLLRWTGGKWIAGGQANVWIQFLPRGSRKWEDIGGFQADKAGRFTARLDDILRDGTWRAYFDGSMRRPRRQASHSGTDYVDVR